VTILWIITGPIRPRQLNPVFITCGSIRSPRCFRVMCMLVGYLSQIIRTSIKHCRITNSIIISRPSRWSPEPTQRVPCLLSLLHPILHMKTVTLTNTKPTPTISKSSSVGEQGVLPGKGPWVSYNGQWYTKKDGQWVKLITQ